MSTNSTIRIHSIRGSWSLEGVLTHSPVKEGEVPKELLSETEEVLRRVASGSLEEAFDHAYLMRITFSPRQLVMTLPVNDQEVKFEFGDEAPDQTLLCIDPEIQFKENDPLHLVAYQSEILWHFENNEWPNGVNASVLNGNAITYNEWMRDGLGLDPTMKISDLKWVADGLVLIGEMEVPWDAQQVFAGTWKLQKNKNNCELLLQENVDQWRRSLVNYQDAAVDATNWAFTPDRIPSNEAPAVGLLAAPLPDQLRWVHKEGLFSFDPKGTLFLVELRGTGMSTARVVPERVVIAGGGASIRIEIGDEQSEVNEEDVLHYSFIKDEFNSWQGRIPLTLEEDSLNLYKNALESQQGDNPWTEELKAWVFTPTGPLQFPLSQAQEANDPYSSLNGLLRISQMTWQKEELEDATPDITLDAGAMLLVLGHRNFSLEVELGREENAWQCLSMKCLLIAPEFRLENALPVYLPPDSNATIQQTPPALPDLSEGDQLDRTRSLSFLRGKATDGAQKSWGLSMDFAPGAQSGALKEGSWAETKLVLPEILGHNLTPLYWYKPPSTSLVPIYPYDESPVAEGENLRSERLLVPFYVNTEEPVSISLVAQHFSGEVTPPKINGSDSLFGWFAPALPGLSILTQENEAIVVKQGKPVSGKVKVLIYHGLPVLSELFALQNSSEEETAFWGFDWWELLAVKDQLASTESQMLCSVELSFHQPSILAADNLPVVLYDLLGPEKLEGFFSLSLFDQTAELTIALDGEEVVSLIEPSQWLRGANIPFKLDSDQGGFLPSTVKESEGELLAGSLAPLRIKDSDVVLDGFGHKQNLRNDTQNLTWIDIPNQNEVSRFLLSTNAGINLQDETSSLNLFWQELPFRLSENGRWIFSADDLAYGHSLLREYRWGTKERDVLGGLNFQVMRLERMECVRLPNDGELVPIQFVISGVLHAREEKIAAAIPEKQYVKVIWENKSEENWEVSGVEGNIWWPLFEPAPDASGAKEEQVAPVPYIASSVAIENGRLTFGNELEPAYWRLNLMGQSWVVPLSFSAIQSSSIDFEVLLSQQTEGIHPMGGEVFLDRLGFNSSGKLELNLEVEWAPGSEKDLCQLFWTYTINKAATHLALSTAHLLQVGQDWHFASYGTADEISLSADAKQLALIFEPSQGEESFQWLEGIYFDATRPWHGYLTISLPLAESSVKSLVPTSTDLLISGAADQDLNFTFEYRAQHGNLPILALHLTGQVLIKSVLRWPLFSDEDVVHTLTAHLHEAQLLESQLQLSEREGIFFELGEDNEGVVALPAMATHRFQSADGEEIHIQWVVPQDLRLITPERLPKLLHVTTWLPEADSFLKTSLPQDTLYWEAGEAHWLQGYRGSIASEQKITLQILGENQLQGGKTLAAQKDWYRVSIPVLSDTNGRLEEWVSDAPERAATFSIEFKQSNENVALDQWAYLPYQVVPKLDRNQSKPAYSQALLTPPALDSFLPYTQSQTGFLWGSLVLDPKVESPLIWKEKEVRLPIKRYDNWKGKKKVWWAKSVSFSITAQSEGVHWLQMMGSADGGDQLIAIETDHITILTIENTSSQATELKVPVWLKEGENVLTFDLHSYRGSIALSGVSITDDYAEDYHQKQLPGDEVAASNEWVNKQWGNSTGKKSKSHRHRKGWKGYRKSPICYKEWIKFSWELEKTGTYWLELRVSTIWKHQYLKIYQGKRRLASVSVPQSKNWDDFASVWIALDLEAGNNDLRFTAWGFGFRLEHVTLVHGITRNTNQEHPLLQTVATMQELCNVESSHLRGAIEKLPAPDQGQLPFEKLQDAQGEPRAMCWQSPWLTLEVTPQEAVDPEKFFTLKLRVLQTGEKWGRQLIREKTFVIGLAEDGTWDKILGLNPVAEVPSNPLLKSIVDWVDESGLQVGEGALLIANSLTMGGHLEGEKWFLLGSKAPIDDQLIAEESIATSDPFLKDLHWESVGIPDSDPLLMGPNYVDGSVYYEPGKWLEPTLPVLASFASEVITAFSAEPEVVAQGDVVKFSWTTADHTDISSILLVNEKSGEASDVTELAGIDRVPKETTIYALRVYDEEGVEMETVRLAVGVRRLVSGSGIGYAWQLSGEPAGYWHDGRYADSSKSDSYHRWVEWSKEVAFNELTRNDTVAELGSLLPGTRRVPDLPEANSLLPARASLLNTSGRPGSKQWWRMALLRSYRDSNLVQRTAGWGGASRFPRPVPLPEGLWPQPPGFGLQPEDLTWPTCSVSQGLSNEDFSSFLIKWADPLYDRQLLAVGQSRQQGPMNLLLDRKVYGPKDVFYPEVKLFKAALPVSGDWRVVLVFSMLRPQNGQLRKIASLDGKIEQSTIVLDGRELDRDTSYKEVKSPDNKEFQQFVFEMGLDMAGEGSFLFSLQHQDQLQVYARLETPQQNYEVTLQAQINAEDALWSPPSSGTTIYRKSEDVPIIVSHGWALPPVEVKRADRFKPDSWSGLFLYTDTLRNDSSSSSDELTYEVRTTTPYGEQPINKAFAKS